MARNNVAFMEATFDHAEALAPRMRPEDLEECRALGYESALEALLHCVNDSSVAYTMFIEGEIAAMFGVAPVDGTILGGPESGQVWLLTGDMVRRHPRAFVAHGRAQLGLLLENCPHLVNLVDSRYSAALRWAKWLGFWVGEAQPTGEQGIPFHPIKIERRAWAH